MIPKVIYKTAPSYHGTIKKINNDIERQNPGWKVKFYNDKDCLNFLKNDFQNDKPIFKKNVIIGYNKLIPGAYKADLWRLCILYEYGGVYIDASSEILEPIESFLDINKDFSIVKGGKDFTLQTAFMSSVKNHSFLKEYISQILKNIKYNIYGTSPLWPTGPRCAWEVAKKGNHLKNMSISLAAIHSEEMRGKLSFENPEVYYVCLKLGKKVIRQYSKNHGDCIKSSKKNHYHYLWKKKKIYI